MPDPFLLAHQVAESVFDIGGKLFLVSIRDQMVRGQSIVDRAVAEGFAGTGQDLLVIGAGAAGVVAAMRAAAWGITTHLIEFDKKPFGRQALCQTRWIDPHEYEWPSDQWLNPSYVYDVPPLHPYHGHPAPLLWSAQWADSLAAGWAARFKAAQATFPHLKYYPSTTLATPLPAMGPGTKTWKVNLSGGQLLTVGMIINAVGFGVEKCEVPRTPPSTYRGLAFWQTDRFRRPNCGLKSPKVAKVVISGGGDGALQDFLRIVTGKPSVRHLYQAIGAAMPSAKKIDRVLRGYYFSHLEGRVAGAENRGSRSYLWGTNPFHDHDVHRLLHLAHSDAVSWALTKGPIRAALKSVLPKIPPDVQLVYSCTHFTQSYPFNRFLVLLIDTFLSVHNGSPSRLIPGAEVTAVAGLGGHICKVASPPLCLGKQHQVTLGPAFHPNCGTVSKPPAPPPFLMANIVIIRHGVTGIGPSPSPWKTLAEIGHPRQLLAIHPSR